MAAVKHENRRRDLFSKKLGYLRLIGIIKAMTREVWFASEYYLTLKVMELEGEREVERTYEALVQEKKPCGTMYFTQFRPQGTYLAFRHTTQWLMQKVRD